MDFWITSDLHYGVAEDGDRAVEALARHACAHPADALLVGGDIACNAGSLARCLALFADFPGAKLAVPGNHDVWLEYEEGDSWALHEREVPDLFLRAGFHPLHLEPRTVGEVAFVGSMGWYDYSFRDDIGIELDWYEKKTLPGGHGPLWNDARYARFGCSDPELTEQLVTRLAAQVASVPPALEIVALIHHVATKELLVHPRSIVPMRWRFANAFLGSERFAELLGAAPAVRQIFCGHIHREKRVTRGVQHYTSIGGSYRHKQLVRATSRQIVEKRSFTG